MPSVENDRLGRYPPGRNECMTNMVAVAGGTSPLRASAAVSGEADQRAEEEMLVIALPAPVTARLEWHLRSPFSLSGRAVAVPANPDR